MGTFIDPQGEFHSERRRNTRLREVFPGARLRIDHFFHASDDWAGSPIDYLALRVIHEAYPDLNTQEVRILMAAIEAKYQTHRQESEQGGTPVLARRVGGR